LLRTASYPSSEQTHAPDNKSSNSTKANRQHSSPPAVSQEVPMVETMMVLLPGEARNRAPFARVRIHKRQLTLHHRQAEAGKVSLDNWTNIG
jgi:hypothetical protein